MNPDFQKMLFAELYRLLGSINSEAKQAGKKVNTLLYTEDDWDRLSITVNDIITEAELIKTMCQAMVRNADAFLRNGPYNNESAGITPLEGMLNSRE